MGDHAGGAGRAGLGGVAPQQTQAPRDREWKQWSDGEDGAKYLDAKYKDRTLALDELERAALNSYTGSSFYEINTALRTAGEGYVPIANIYTQSATDYIIAKMDDAFTRPQAILADDLVVHRYFNGNANEVAQLGIGEVLTDYGFMSTTTNASGGYRYAIRVPAGTKALWVKPVSNWQSENELLLKRGTTMRVVDRDSWDMPILEVIGQT